MDIEGILDRHRELVEQKFHEYNGLVSKETIAYIVAQEMGLDLEEEITPELKVSHLTPGMRKVNLSGKILATSPIEEYSRKDGSTAQVQALIMRDDSERVEIVLWNQPELKPGTLLNIKGGYVKNTEEGLQLNVSERGTIQTIGFEPLQLNEIIDGSTGLTIRGIVWRVNPDKLFQSKRGEIHRASSVTLFQDDLKARAIFWEEESEKPLNLHPFQEVELTDLKASINDSNLLELKTSPATAITVCGQVEPIDAQIALLGEIERPQLDVDIGGEISSIMSEPDRIALTIADENSELRLTVLHQELISQLKTASPGRALTAKSVDIIRAPSGLLEARSTIWSEFSLH